jgi:hypothetical protein
VKSFVGVRKGSGMCSSFGRRIGPRAMLVALSAILVVGSGCRSKGEEAIDLKLPPDATAQKKITMPPPTPRLEPGIYKKVGKPVSRTVEGEKAARKAILGDMNGDGKVTNADAEVAIDLAVSKADPDPQQLAAGDMNNDGKINISEVTAINRALKEKIVN